MHCYNSSTPTESNIYSPRSNFSIVRDDGNNGKYMYEKKPFFVCQRCWDTKTVLPKVYKLQSINPRNKYKAKIHKDDGLLGIKFTLNKMISEFICASKKLNLDYVTSFAKFGNVLLSHYQTDWKQVLHVHFLEPVDTEAVKPAQDCALAENFLREIDLFLIRTLNKKKPRDCQYNYLAPGGTMASTRSSSPALWTTSIVLRRCSTSQSSFPRKIFLRPLPLYRYSGFSCPFIAQIARSTSAVGASSAMRRYRLLPSTSNGSIQRKYDKQLCLAAKRKLCHELEEHYREKLKRLSKSQEHHSSHRYQDKQGSGSTCNGMPIRYSDCCRFKARRSSYKDSRGDCKAPLKDSKFNRLCHLHGANSKHSYDECRQNPKNQASTNNSNNYVEKTCPQHALP
jgi:hypothetical protein